MSDQQTTTINGIAADVGRDWRWVQGVLDALEIPRTYVGYVSVVDPKGVAAVRRVANRSKRRAKTGKGA